ncbi:MAG: peptidoglycan-binding protein, partial [Clostridia bacterium]|nr:peptidoglycan-binding protein [Clostridia bacterium]
QDGVKCYLNGKYTEQSNSVLLEMVVENNTSKELTFKCSLYVNGWEIYKNTYFGDLMGVLPETKTKSKMFINHDDCEISGFSDIESATISVTAAEGNSTSAADLCSSGIITVNFGGNAPAADAAEEAATGTLSYKDGLAVVPNEEVVFFDQDGLKCYLTGDVKEQSNSTILDYVVENNTGKEVTIKCSLYVNGWEIYKDTYMGDLMGIQAGSKVKAMFFLQHEDCEISSYDDIEKMTVSFSAAEGNGFSSSPFSSIDKLNLYYNLSEEELAQAAAPEVEAPAVVEAPAAEEVDPAKEAELAAIAEAAAAAPTAEPIQYETLQKGSKGDKVKEMQTVLKALGHLSGSADGDFGPGTEKAVKAFQAAEGLEQTGIADNKTLTVLYNKELPKKQDIEVKITRLSDNSIGTPEVFVRFTNQSGRTIDRIDFGVYAYDAYGDLIHPYNRYDYTGCFYDGKLKSGSSSPSDWRWTLYDCDGAVKVRVFIEKYHFTDGETVEVPFSEAVWYTYEK